MANPNLLTVIGGLACALALCVFVEAATRQTRSYDQCHQRATSLKHGANDESDRWGYDNYMSRCMYGTDAETAVRIEHRMATRGDREYRREDRREVRRQPQIDRRVLAQAEQKYQKYAVPMVNNCRDIAKLFGWRLDDESDIDQANKFITDCMAGRVGRR